MKLLRIDSSITGANSASRQLSAALVAALKAAIPGLEVIRRDLDANPIPHLDSKRLPTGRPANAPEGAVGIPDEGGSDVLDEFLSVDILVIGAPMYNFGIPSQLKPNFRSPSRAVLGDPQKSWGAFGPNRIVVLNLSAMCSRNA